MSNVYHLPFEDFELADEADRETALHDAIHEFMHDEVRRFCIDQGIDVETKQWKLNASAIMTLMQLMGRE